jgi:Asp-tRNA(Asn)/Glu-tRNA(Gln) amidotransferase C subunit
MNGKLQKVILKSGNTLQFRVVKNFRDAKGTPTNKLIKTLLNAPEKRLNDYFFRVAAWLKINNELRELQAQKILSDADVEKIKSKFEKVLPRVDSVQPIQSKNADVDLSKYKNIL